MEPLLRVQGLVSRERLYSDERNVVVTLTEKGEALKERAISIPAKIGACISIGADEAAALYKLLYKILGQVTAE